MQITKGLLVMLLLSEKIRNRMQDMGTFFVQANDRIEDGLNSFRKTLQSSNFLEKNYDEGINEKANQILDVMLIWSGSSRI